MSSSEQQQEKENNNSNASKKTAVIIVGAGAAGLTAAYDLKRANDGSLFDVTILEASGRRGGRLRKDDETFGADVPLDLGGEWLHVHPDILKTIVDDESAKISGEERTILFDSKSYRIWDGTKFHPRKVTWKEYKWVDYTWYDFFDDYIAPTVWGDIKYNCPVTEIKYCSSSSNKSGGGALGEEGQADAGPGNHHHRAIAVTCANGETFRADYAVVTVPLAVLKDGDIAFAPELPPKTSRALKDMIMTGGIKVFLEFSEKFFDDFVEFQADLIDAKERRKKVEDSSERVYYDATFGKNNPNDRCILALFANGKCAEKYLALSSSEDELIALILEELDHLYSGMASRTYVRRCVVQNWAEEPFIRGAYTDHIKGNRWSAVDDLRRPLFDRRVYLAGEHVPVPTSDYEYGFVHGAALSGRFAANQIKAIAREPQRRRKKRKTRRRGRNLLLFR